MPALGFVFARADCKQVDLAGANTDAANGEKGRAD